MFRLSRSISGAACVALWLVLLPACGRGQQVERKKADFQLTLNLVQGTDQGSGDKFDRQTEKLKAAFDKVNRKFFRGLREIEKPMLLDERKVFPAVSGQMEVKVAQKAKDKYPVDLTWKKSDGTEHIKMRIHLAPGKLFAVQGTPYQNGNLWAVLQIEEGTFYLEEEPGPAPSAVVPPLRKPEAPKAPSPR